MRTSTTHERERVAVVSLIHIFLASDQKREAKTLWSFGSAHASSENVCYDFFSPNKHAYCVFLQTESTFETKTLFSLGQCPIFCDSFFLRIFWKMRWFVHAVLCYFVRFFRWYRCERVVCVVLDWWQAMPQHKQQHQHQQWQPHHQAILHKNWPII